LSRFGTNRRDQDQIFVRVNGVDLDYQQINARRSDAIPSCAACPEADLFCRLPDALIRAQSVTDRASPYYATYSSSAYKKP
jgi:hypothetical protein